MRKAIAEAMARGEDTFVAVIYDGSSMGAATSSDYDGCVRYAKYIRSTGRKCRILTYDELHAEHERMMKEMDYAARRMHMGMTEL